MPTETITVTKTVEEEQEITVCSDCYREVDHDEGPFKLDLCTGCADEHDQEVPSEQIITAGDYHDKSFGGPDGWSLKENIGAANGLQTLTAVLLSVALALMVLEMPAVSGFVLVFGLVAALAAKVFTSDTKEQIEEIVG